MGTAAYSHSLNQSRKNTPLGKPAVQTYVKHLDVETRDFIRQCLEANEKPIDPLRMLQRMSLSLDLMLCWGRRISLKDPLLTEIVQVEHEIVNLRNTMTNLQDCIPVLRFPWNNTTKKALELRQRRDTYFNQLNGGLDKALLEGTNAHCIRAELLGREDVNQEELNLICLTFISAGMAPTVATLQWSIALLAKRPDIQEATLRAIRHYYQDNPSLRDIEDDQGCQYVVALIKECLRLVKRLSGPSQVFVSELTITGTLLLLEHRCLDRRSRALVIRDDLSQQAQPCFSMPGLVTGVGSIESLFH
jgi:3-hydroxyphenylacetate 6-hydroxylase